jgi:CPA2 family monovalent cation:H+ antiporter-2
MAGKAVVSLAITPAFPYPARTGFVVAAGMAQAGEFSFIVADQAIDLHLMSAGTYNVILAAAAISIALNPLAFWLGDRAEQGARRIRPLWRVLNREGGASLDLPPVIPEHVLIVGYGRVGQVTGNALQSLGVSLTVIEANLDLARRLVRANIRVVFGDAGNPEVLEHAGVHTARLLVIAVPDESTTLLVVNNARRANPSLHILARADNEEELRQLQAAGVQDVVVPQYEGGLQVMRHALQSLGYPDEGTQEFASAIRGVYYTSPASPPPVG